MTKSFSGDAFPFPSILGSPLDTAISVASANHPYIVATPKALRSTRQASLSAAAKAMASVCNIDFADAENASRIAIQMVDEAALNLRATHDRVALVQLSPDIEARHHLLARALEKEPDLRAVGMNCALSLARIELAINRALCARTEHAADPTSSSALVKQIISTLVRSCLSRGLSVENMTDCALIELVQDTTDTSILQAGSQ